MIGQSTSEYVFIRVSIACLRAIAPLCILHAAASWYMGEWMYSRWLGYYAWTEAIFYLFLYLPRSYSLQKVRTLSVHR